MATEMTQREGSLADAPSPDGAAPSIGELVRDATGQLSVLIRGEIELAKAEISESAKRAGRGSAFLFAAAAVAVFSLIFAFIALAEGLVALDMWRWASFLIVFGIMLLLAVLMAIIGLRTLKKVSGPKRTLHTVKGTADWARHPTQNKNTPDGKISSQSKLTSG